MENYIIYPDATIFNVKRHRFIKQSNHSGGYKVVRIDNKNHLVHRLVAQIHIPNPDNKPEVDHINRDRKDNRVENLRWVSRSENEQNKGIQMNNTSGHKNISHMKDGRYRYARRYKGKGYVKNFHNLNDALCYKFIITLKCKVS
tara:strand:+ start:56 stop:487 length:432 start_codon:yes stop_codon:yes gene_type:complete